MAFISDSLSLKANILIVLALLSTIHQCCSKDISQIQGFSTLQPCVSVVLVSWVGDNSAACEPASSNSYNTLISNSVSFTCISAGQTPISPQISAGLETFHEYCIDRLGDHDDSTTTRNSLPTSTGASPASRSPGPTVGPDSAAQAGSSGSSNRSVVLGCAIGISIGIVLIASIIGILMWRRRKTRPSGNMPTTNPDGLDFSQANTGPYEAPSDHQRRPLPQADEKAELPGQELSRTELLAVPTDAYLPQYTPRASASAGRGITRHEMPVNERSVELEGDRENVVPSPPTPKRPGTEPFTGLG